MISYRHAKMGPPSSSPLRPQLIVRARALYKQKMLEIASELGVSVNAVRELLAEGS